MVLLRLFARPGIAIGDLVIEVTGMAAGRFIAADLSKALDRSIEGVDLGVRARFKSFSGVAIPCGSADEHADRSDHSPGG